MKILERWIMQLLKTNKLKQARSCSSEQWSLAADTLIQKVSVSDPVGENSSTWLSRTARWRSRQYSRATPSQCAKVNPLVRVTLAGTHCHAEGSLRQ